MTVQCVQCTNFSLKGCPAAQHGFGNCRHDKVGNYQSARYERTCAKYSPADADVAKARMAWLEKQEGKSTCKNNNP